MTFRRYAAERIGITVLVLFLCACLCYVCFHVIAIDTGSQWDPGEATRLHRFENQSFGSFLWQLVGHGSLGRTIRGTSPNGYDLNSIIGDLVPATLSVASGALVVAMLVGIPLGLAWSRWRRVRFFGTPFVYLMFGLIQVWVAIFLSWQLAYNAGIFPFSGYCTFTPATGRFSDCGGPVQWAYHLVLPSVTLGFLLAAVHTVVVRRLSRGVAAAQNEPTGDRTAAVRAAVVHRRIAYGKMVARNWFWLVGATLFAEVMFNLHGLAQEALVFAAQGDLAGLQAVILFTSLIAFGGWLVVDLVGAAVSPHWREL
jgi:peptide/nickel transport system permease protein